MKRRLRLRLSLKITLLVMAFLISTFLAVTPIIISTVTQNAKKSLVNQSKSFASLSTRPIGDAFLLYKDSGLVRLSEQIQRISETDTTIANTIIVDVTGQILYQHKESEVSVSPQQAASFEPIYESDSDGFASRVIYPFLEQSGAHRYTMIYMINSAEIKATLDSLRNNILFVGTVITLLAGSTLIILIEFLFVVPLKRMTQLAAAISVGDYGKTIPIKGHDEINQLANALNTMSARLKQSIEALKSAEQLKSEFLIISSHNFRTPLTVISGYLDLLEDMQLDGQAVDYLNTIKTYARELTELTNDMLTVAELEGQDKPKISLEMIDLSNMLIKLLPAIKQQLNKKDQMIKAEFGMQPIHVRVQVTYLQTTLWNLIDNASKFTPKKGIITLAVRETPQEVLIDIKDTGIGIAEAEKPKLFTKFHRGTSLMKYEYEGIGLGLYMTKLMLEFMGGSISFESQEGAGSTFTIHLPKASSQTNVDTVIPIGRSGLLKAKITE